MKTLTLLALSFALTGCYGTQIAALRDQMSYFETKQAITNAHMDQLERDVEDSDRANRRISTMVSDMNEYNVCPRQLDRRLQAIEKALKLKKISFTPDWIYRVRADGGGYGVSSWISTASAVYMSTGTLLFSTITFRTPAEAINADSRNRRSNPYSN